MLSSRAFLQAKPRLNLLALVMLGSMLVVLPGCSDGDDPENDQTSNQPVVDPNDTVPPPSQDTISDTLRNRMDYGTLLRLIENADLAGELQGDNAGLGWTLFAPSDDIFGDDDAFDGLTAEQENDLVRLHLYSGTLSFADLAVGPLAMTQGTVQVEQGGDGMLRVGGARIIARDRVFRNGVIHFVDSLLSPAQ